MANEITITGQIAVANPVALINTGFAPGAISVSQSGQNYQAGTVAVTNTPAIVPQGSIVNLGVCMFMNTGGNPIELKLGAGGTLTIEILPGETSGPFRFVPGSALYVVTTIGLSTMLFFLAEA